MPLRTPAQKRRRWVLALWGALSIAVLSLVNISPYRSDFRISVAVVLLPILAFMVRDMPVASTAVLGGVGVLLVRFFGFLGEGATPVGALLSAWPEMIFYWVYGGLLALYLRWVSLHPYRVLALLPLVAMDLSANVVELTLRMGAGALAANKLLPLLLAAALRCAMACFAIWVLQRYGLMVMRRADAVRYRRLLLMTSMLGSELFWMEKSVDMIENTMASSFELYKGLSHNPDTALYATKAMQIATDVHEVKKEYLLITRGIAEALQESTQKDGMLFSDICDILTDSLANGKADVTLHLDIGRDFFTRQHYPLMSVLHNLLTNAVEAAQGVPCHVDLRQRQEGNAFVFEVEDDSGGIPEDTLAHIFLPGFSSKMDSTTGVLNRGLGLCLVKELVTGKFLGEIAVQPQSGGTCFVVRIPVSAMEEKP